MAANAPAESQAVSLKTWIAVGGSLIAAFMAVLNIQVTNSSLPDIEGGIGTGGVNGTWISTAYLIGEIVVIPMTDYLSRVFSLRRYFIVNTVLFLLLSVACGQAHSLSEMILLRGLQGFTGGVLIPLAFTIIVSMLPPSKRAIGLAGFAVTATFAPAIGPTIGGWLTDTYGWQTIFYMNLVPGAVMLAALIYALPRSEMQLGLLRRGDWLGIALMAIGLAAFQTVLDDGNTYDWFGSPLIVRLSLISAVALGAFIVVELVREEPLINLRLLGRRNFGLGTLGNFLLGFALYGSSYLLPQYLAVSQGFNAQQSGEVIAWTGLPQLLIIPFVPLLMRRIDSRLLVSVGLTVFAVSCFMNLNLDRDYAAPQLLVPDITRAFGQALVMTPLSAIAMVGITPAEAGAASGLFNMLRNLGGAIGTAAVETFFTKREQYHSFIINEHVSLLEPATRARLASLQQYFMAHGVPDPAAAMHQAVIAVGQTIRAEATIMGYADCFGLIGVALLGAVLSVALLRKGSAGGAGALKGFLATGRADPRQPLPADPPAWGGRVS
jgi:MFS transporter, DHA2 family, multidrug resistance protein